MVVTSGKHSEHDTEHHNINKGYVCDQWQAF